MKLEGFDQRGDSVTGYLAIDGSKEAVVASCLIGADGAHSTVRKQLGVDFPGHRMPGEWSLADIRMETPLQPDAANVVFGDDGILFAIGFKEGVYRIASNRPNVIERLPEGTVVHEVLWESDFAVSHRLAERYSVGRVFLAGDAAHIHSPFGARGMNLGIEDAAVLVNAIATGRLEEYSRQRSKVSRAVVRMVKAQTRLATSRNPIAGFVRAHVAPRVLASNTVQRRLAERMLGLGYQQIDPGPVSPTYPLSAT